jgi:hypothetical protein
MADKYGKHIRKYDSDGQLISDEYIEHYSPWQADRGYNYKYKSVTIKIYFYKKLPSCFNMSDRGRFLTLLEHVYSDTNLLASRIAGKIVPLTNEKVMEISELSKSRFSTFMAKAKRHKIIKVVKRDDEKFYCFSPIYFNSMKYIPLSLYLDFQTEMNECLSQDVIDQYLDWQERVNGKPKRKEETK